MYNSFSFTLDAQRHPRVTLDLEKKSIQSPANDAKAKFSKCISETVTVQRIMSLQFRSNTIPPPSPIRRGMCGIRTLLQPNEELFWLINLLCSFSNSPGELIETRR
ncbi:hypothetical protein CDAR_521821 [Caerostris darwini]|uniref:Uncharacterized protein n=1 Tax=Caerostris darwini TaxID=1538125 RepID=A0AAV4S002_9ARAC|nr:hypothetical protein CDAR_521821 [Caerostris darwini]